MQHAIYNKTHTSGHTFRPFSLLETLLIENEGEDGKAQTDRVIWTWKVHEVALHEASHREGLLMLGNCKEAQLKKLSDEITRKAQEKLSAKRTNVKL